MSMETDGKGRKMAEIVNTAIRFPPELYDLIKTLAEAEGISIRSWATRALIARVRRSGIKDLGDAMMPRPPGRPRKLKR